MKYLNYKNRPLVLLVVPIIMIGTCLYFWLRTSPEEISKNTRSLGKIASHQNVVLEKNDTNVPEAKTHVSYPKIRGDLNLEQAKALIDEFYGKHNNLDERASFASNLITQLCRLGSSEVAWNLIDEGSGTIRNEGIHAFFNNSDLPRGQLLDRISELPYKRDASLAFTGLVWTLGVEEIDSFLKSKEATALFANRDIVLNSSGAIGSLLELRMMEGGDDAKIVAIALDLAKSGNLDNASVIKIVREDGTKNSFEKWTAVASLGITSRYGNHAEIGRKEMIENIVKEDAPRTMEILGGSSGNQSDNNLSNAVQSWVQLDSTGASNWYGMNKNKFTEQQRTVIATSFLNAAESYLEFQSARIWAAELPSGDVRNSALEKIARKEASYLEAKSKSLGN